MTHAYLLGSAGFIADAGLPLTDRGFRYGMSVFETIALREGCPRLLDPHLDRLLESADRAQFSPPTGWREAVRALVETSPIPEGVVRIYVTAGDSDVSPARVALLFEALPIPTELSVAPAITVEFTPATPFGKTGNYWPHFLARPASGEEPVLVSPGGALLGGASSNLVILRAGRFLTPVAPLRRGIVRDWVNADRAALTLADLVTADAAFLTNSRIGLCALTRIDGRELPSAPPEVAALWQRYRTEVLGVR